MQISDPALDRLATAKRLLLDPYGLDEAHLQKVLASIFEHRADYADLYFQYTRSESFSLEEGIVKSGSFDIEQGVGVRAVVGDKTAFAYSDDISLESLTEAAVSARSIARAAAAASRWRPRWRCGPSPRFMHWTTRSHRSTPRPRCACSKPSSRPPARAIRASSR
jgi:TldD protein